jgi:hypothetical protein
MVIVLLYNCISVDIKALEIQNRNYGYSGRIDIFASIP